MKLGAWQRTFVAIITCFDDTLRNVNVATCADKALWLQRDCDFYRRSNAIRDIRLLALIAPVPLPVPLPVPEPLYLYLYLSLSLPSFLSLSLSLPLSFSLMLLLSLSLCLSVSVCVCVFPNSAFVFSMSEQHRWWQIQLDDWSSMIKPDARICDISHFNKRSGGI